MTLSFWLDHSLDSRTEFCLIFWSFFGQWSFKNFFFEIYWPLVMEISPNMGFLLVEFLVKFQNLGLRFREIFDEQLKYLQNWKLFRLWCTLHSVYCWKSLPSKKISPDHNNMGFLGLLSLKQAAQCTLVSHSWANKQNPAKN